MRQLLTLIFSFVFAAPLMAQAEFEANSVFDANIVSAGDGVTFAWEVFPENEDVFLEGVASGFADTSDESSSASLAVGEIFGLFALTGGEATNGGLSSTVAESFGLLTVENTASSAQAFEVELDWSILADTIAFDTNVDQALSDSFISVFLDFDTVLLDQSVSSNSFFDDGRSELGDSLFLGFELDPGQIVEFDFLVSTSGLASNSSVVPEPNATFLMTMAFTGIALLRKRNWQHGLS